MNINKNLKKNLLIIPKYLWPHLSNSRKRQLIGLFILNLLSGISEVFSLVIILPFLEILTTDQNNINLEKMPLGNILNYEFIYSDYQNGLLISLILVIKVIAITAVIRLLNLFFNCRISGLIGIDLSTKLFQITLSKKYNWHLENNSSTSISATTFQTDQMVTGIQAFLMLLTSLIVSVFICISLFFISFRVTVFCVFICGSIYFLMGFATKEILQKNSKSIIENDKLRIKILQESFGNIREILLNLNSKYFIKKFHLANRNTRLAISKNIFLSSYPRFLLESIVIISISLIAFIFQTSQNNSSNFLAILGTLILGLQRLLPAIQQIYSGYTLVNGNLASIFSVIDKLNNGEPPIKKSYNKFCEFRVINTKNLSYKFPSKKLALIKDVNLTIKRGEKIGIIGSTGSGKTTLINILMGLLEPTKGNLIVDNLNVYEKDNYFNWRKVIAHVPQNIYLSDDTIADNIAFGLDKKKISMARVIASAKKAQLHEFIMKNNLGYSSRIGEMGIKLSGGQRQRIAIARALYKNSQFLVLDEATSALDSECEKKIMNEIYKLKNLTMIFIAHRLGTLSGCDKIIEIKEGVIFKIYLKNQIKELTGN